MNLTHRQLEIFQSLIRTQNVTETATQLYSSQPTISRELKVLEAELGFKLFRRENRRLSVTPQAVAFHAIVQRSFVGLGEIARAAHAIRDDRLQRVTVACIPAFAHALMPQVIRKFHDSFPGASLKIHSIEETVLTRELMTKVFDLGVVESKAAGNSFTTSLYAGDLLCIMPSDHPLARHERLEAAQFSGHEFIYYSEEDAYRRLIDSQFQEAATVRKLLVETTTATSIGPMVAAGIGVSIVNPLTALAFEGPNIVLRPLARPIPYHLNIWQPDAPWKNQLGSRFVKATVQTVSSIVEALGERGLCRAGTGRENISDMNENRL